MTTHYAPTEQGGMNFVSERRPGEVRIPNYVYDIWMPLLGIEAIGVYAVYCRLEREGTVKAMTQQRLAKEMRIGVGKLEKMNDILQRYKFIKVRKPMGQARLMHWTTEIVVKDPPREIPVETIEELKHPKGYEVLCPWLMSTETPNGSSDMTNQSCDEIPDGNANFAPSDVAPSDVEEEPAAPDSPPAEEWPAEVVALGEDDSAETEKLFKDPKPRERHTAESVKAGIAKAAKTFEENGGRPGVADPTQDVETWGDTSLLMAFAAVTGTPWDQIKDSSLRDWPAQFKDWSESWGERAPTPDETLTCMRGILESEHDWKTWTSPRSTSFQETMDVMLSRHRAGKPWHKDGKRKGGSSTPRQSRPVESYEVTF